MRFDSSGVPLKKRPKDYSLDQELLADLEESVGMEVKAQTARKHPTLKEP